MSLFLVILIAPSKQFSKIVAKLSRFESRSYTMYMFTVFLLNVNSSCYIRQLPSNFTKNFSLTYSYFLSRLLLFTGGLKTSSDNPFDSIFLKYLSIGLNTK